MDGCLVFARGLGRSRVGSADWLWSLVFASAPWGAVGLGEGSYKVPVHSFVSGCLIACVAGGHLEKGGKGEYALILHGFASFAPVRNQVFESTAYQISQRCSKPPWCKKEYFVICAYYFSSNCVTHKSLVWITLDTDCGDTECRTGKGAVMSTSPVPRVTQASSNPHSTAISQLRNSSQWRPGRSFSWRGRDSLNSWDSSHRPCQKRSPRLSYLWMFVQLWK